MKGIITIFALPQELEDLALTLNGLKRNSVYLDDSTTYTVDITMCLSEELTDWAGSKLPIEYVKERAAELAEKFLDWCDYNILWGDSILGCVSQRRHSLKEHPDADFFIWLDCDFIFKDTTLSYMTLGHSHIRETGEDLFILTPQFVKQWDNTWDMVVNEQFLNHPVDYELIADVYKDTLPDIGEVNIKSLPGFKFAGGWFTLLTRELLERITVPESLGHYGMEDTFVVECCKIMKNCNIKTTQYALQNHLIGESYIHRPNETVQKYISSISRKEEFTKVATSNFQIEIQKFYKKTYE